MCLSVRERVWQGACMAGACVVGGMHGRGACMAGETATAAGSMHPTGMHSCLVDALHFLPKLLFSI